MATPWTVTVRGARGSRPTAGADYGVYGGNTACFTVDWGSGSAILDAGSGLSGLSGAGPWHILLSHLHLDHIAGLMSFDPLLDSAADIHFYGPAGYRTALRRLIAPPYWPLPLAQCQARTVFHDATAPFTLPGGVAVSVLAGRHPGGSWLYRLSDGEKSLVYALDCEMTGDMPDRLADFALDTDLLIWDASFTPEDIHPGWGHSTWAEGLAIRAAAGAARVLMAHHNPSYTDDFLRAQEALAVRQDPACIFAREGMTITL